MRIRKIYEHQTLLIILALISFVLGIYPLPNGLFNDRIFTGPTHIVYAKENKSLEEPTQTYARNNQIYGKDSERPNKDNESVQGQGPTGLSVPKYITRTNRKTGKQESVRVPKEVGRAVCNDKYRWPCEQALRVASCEGDFRPGVISKTGDVGLFQINPVHGYSVSYLNNIRNNIDVAYKLWTRQGFGPWYSSKSCHNTK